MKVRQYELDSRKENIKLNKTAGRFYFEKMQNNFNEENFHLYKALFYEVKNLNKKEFFKTFVSIINLETNSYCNRTCSYCPLSFFDRSKKENMNEEIFEKIILELEEIEYESTICLNLYNEPLSDEKLIEKIKFIKQKCNVFLRFNSNGDFLNPFLLEELSNSGLDSINITLHTKNNEIYSDRNAINKLNKFYKKLCIAPPQYNITSNYQITSLYKIKNLEMIVNTTNWGIYGNDRGGIINKLSMENRTKPCVKIFREFTIDYLGNVFPCCNIFPSDPKNEKFIFGNVKTQSIFEIFALKNWRNWRKNLFIESKKQNPCATCRDALFDENIDYKKHEFILEELEKG